MNGTDDRLEVGELNGFLWAKRVVARMVGEGLLTDAQSAEFGKRLRAERELSIRQRAAAPTLSIVKVGR